MLLLCSAQMMLGIDLTVVNVALAAIGRDLGAGVSSLQWTIDTYAVAVGSLLMLTGSLADRLGRRRVLIAGIVVFGIGSALCSAAWSVPSLVVARAIQGAGAAMISPVALALVAVTFPVARDRARALGLWGVIVGLGLGLGPVVGGVLLQTVGWRGIFWINVPLCAALAVAIARKVPESRPSTVHRADPAGQILVALGLAGLVYALIEGPALGWTSAPILAVLTGVAITVPVLVGYQLRRVDPLIDLRFLRSVPFAAAMMLGALAFALLGAFLFVIPLILQAAHDRSALVTGLCLAPFAVGIVGGSLLAGRLIARHGIRPSICLSALCLCVATAIMADVDITVPLPALLVAFVLFGLGFSLVHVPVNAEVVVGLPAHRTGQAAAMAATSKQIGLAVGVAVAGGIAGTGGTGPPGTDFDLAARPVWFVLAGVGVTVLIVGLVASSAWARGTTEAIAHLFDHPDPRHPEPRPRHPATGPAVPTGAAVAAPARR
nr:MFS transporter [Nakamurella flavida]